MTLGDQVCSIPDEDLILPPDFSAAGFRSALVAMGEVVGERFVQICTQEKMKPDTEGHYFDLPLEHDLFYTLEKETFLAGAVVTPGSVEEVSAVVKLANKYLTPLWPISKGRNLGEPCAKLVRQS